MLNTMVAAQSGKSGFGFASRSAAGREPGVRDFLKLCARVDALGVFDRQKEDEVCGHLVWWMVYIRKRCAASGDLAI